MLRKNFNSQQSNNPLKLRHRYSHIPLQYKNTNILHVNNNLFSDKIFFKKNKDDSEHMYDFITEDNNDFENILPNSEKDEDDDNTKDDDNTNDDNMGDNFMKDNDDNMNDNFMKDDDNDNTNDNYIEDSDDNTEDNDMEDSDDNTENNDMEDSDDNYVNDNYMEDSDNNYTDDNYYDDNNLENEDDGDGDEQCNERIIDKAIDISELSNGSSGFSPYFNNATEALLFCWIQKHNICKYIYFNTYHLFISNIVKFLFHFIFFSN